jgi:hypothetical protein
MMKDLPTDEEMEEARKRYLETQKSYAISLRYDPRKDVFVLVMRAGAMLLIPRIAIEELCDVPSSDIGNIVLDQDGCSIRYAPFDVDISVPGLVCAVTGAYVWHECGEGGQTPEKATVSSANKRKHGGPRKDRSTVSA